jgi:hypothetical protein
MGNATAWRDYQEWVATWAQDLAGDDAVVEHDVRLPGRRSGVQRQVDALVKGQFAGGVVGSATAIIESKLYGRNVNVTDIHSFAGLIEDVGADFGVLVTNRGFSAAARRVADENRIRLHV